MGAELRQRVAALAEVLPAPWPAMQVAYRAGGPGDVHYDKEDGNGWTVNFFVRKDNGPPLDKPVRQAHRSLRID